MKIEIEMPESYVLRVEELALEKGVDVDKLKRHFFADGYYKFIGLSEKKQSEIIDILKK